MAVDRAQVIAEAMRQLQSGKTVDVAGVCVLTVFERLERGADGTGPAGFVAFKTAQRIVAETGGAS